MQLRSVLPALAFLAVACEGTIEPLAPPHHGAQYSTYWIDEGVQSDTIPLVWYTTPTAPDGGNTAHFDGVIGKGSAWTKMSWGNYILAQVKTTVRYGTGTVGIDEGEAEFSVIAPTPNSPTKTAYAQVSGSKTCGHRLDLHGQHKIEVNALKVAGSVKVNLVSDSWSSTNYAEQDACAPPGGESRRPTIRVKVVATTT